MGGFTTINPAALAATAACCFLFLAGGTPLGSALAADFEPALPLTATGEVQDISRFLWFLVDPEGTRGVAEVLSDADGFQRNPDEILNPGTASGIIWVRFDVHNTGTEPADFIVSLNRASVDTAEIHLIHDEHIAVLLADTAAARAASFSAFHTLAGRFPLASGDTASVLIRFRGSNWSALQMTAGPEEAFQADQRTKLFVFLLLLGGITTLVLYGSVAFVFLGRQIVLLYAFAQTAFFIFFAHLAGYTTVYLWPDAPESGRIVAPVALAVFLISMAQFARLFFETRARAHSVDRVLLVCIVGGGLALLATPLDYLVPSFDSRWPVRTLYGVAIVCWTVLPCLALYATVRWSRDFWPVAVAWTSMAVLTIGMQLVFTGALATIPLGKNAYGVVIYLEALLLAIAIALRIRGIRAEASQAEQKLSESLRLQLEESRRAQRATEERGWALQDLSEKGRLLLAAGHDSRQMLSALRNYAAGLRRHTDDDDVIEATRGIDEIANSLKDILSSIVEGSPSGGIADGALALDTFTAASLLGPLQLIHGRDASEKGIDLRVRLSDRVLVTDRLLVARVLSNFVSNAIKYTESGRILVGLRARGSGSCIQVWDTGCGIDEDALRILLDADAGAMRVQTREEGTGSGLGIARALAKRLGGSIATRSAPGRGSVFELVLPSVRKDAPECAAARVLLLDADPEQAAHLDTAAIQAGVQLTWANTPEAARGLLESLSGSDAVVLIDQHFGGVDAGVHLFSEIRERHREHRCLLLSYDRSTEARSRLTDISPLLLYKPVSTRAFREAVLRLLHGAAGGSHA